MSKKEIAAAILLISLIIMTGCSTPGTPSPPTPFAVQPEETTPTAQVNELHELISQEMMFSYIEDLCSFQSHSGWRNSGTIGEFEAIDYVAQTLGEFAHLQSLGLTLEHQSFHVHLATEIWESRLFLTVDGIEKEVPTNAITGHRKIVSEALHFDSDGTLNDSDPNPIEAAGKVLVLNSADDVLNLKQTDVEGNIVLLDYGAADHNAGEGVGAELITALIDKGAAGMILVTEGHGKYVGDGTTYEGISVNEVIPMLYIRLEDLAPLGISSWDGLSQIEEARLIWDTDVFSPGTSGNLVARIPGTDSTRAVILGAHIDSANTPGASDNGLNDAVLLEMARVIDKAAIQPPVDIYLAWLGSEELGFYGALHFVNTHQEILDQSIAAFLMDGFTADPTDEGTILGMATSSYSRFGNTEVHLSDYLTQKGEFYNVPIEFTADYPIYSSDNGPFYGFVPTVRFAFGSYSIGSQFHSPYDTMEIVLDQGEVMEQLVIMSLAAALDLPEENLDLRVTPEPEYRALILATHTDVLHMTPGQMTNLVRVLVWEGFDVDVLPYGQSPSPEDLANTDLVIALPVIDYPSADVDQVLSDEEWNPDEIDLLVNFVEEGGFLVLTNSANRLFFADIYDINEDWVKVNPLAAPFGITYESDPFPITVARAVYDHPLTEKITSVQIIPKNGLPINLQTGLSLAEVGGKTAIGLVDFGEAGGQVLALSDLGSFDLYDFEIHEIDNFSFFQNLARFVRDR